MRVRVGIAPRAQPFEESIDSLQVAMRTAEDAGIEIIIEKVRGGGPGFQNFGPMVTHMLTAGDTHLFLAADDILYPPDTIVRLVNADKDVICGVYRKNSVTQLQPANYSVCDEAEFVRRIREGGIYQTDFASAHTLTIKREVLEKMIADHPELAYREGKEICYALSMPMIYEGVVLLDDWAFSLRARQSGFTLWDDFGCLLKHYCSGFLGFEALLPQR